MSSRPLRTQAVDYDAVLHHTTGLLQALGFDPSNDPSLFDTPRRVASFWKEFLDYQPGSLETTFDLIQADQMVILSPIRVWSLCEHHLMPFYADLALGYLANDKILGLSKMARIAHLHAHTLQVQERMVRQIADHLAHVTNSPDVAVIARGEHLCMTMRGIKTQGLMTSSSMHGIFRDNPEARAEFIALSGIVTSVRTP